MCSHSGPVGTSTAALELEVQDEQIQLPYYDCAQDPVVSNNATCAHTAQKYILQNLALFALLQAFIYERAQAFVDLPSIYRRRPIDEIDIAEVELYLQLDSSAVCFTYGLQLTMTVCCIGASGRNSRLASDQKNTANYSYAKDSFARSICR